MRNRGVLLAVAMIWMSAIGSAQTTATISGVVRDSSGAVVPSASIAAKNIETGANRTVVTDAQGRYQIPGLNVGRYEIEVSATGFQTSLRRGIVLTVGQEAVANIILEVGAVNERIEVAAEAPLVETTSSSVSSLVANEQIEALPLNGRSFDNLALLQPGVAVSQFTATNIQTGFTNKMSIRGSRPEQNSFLLDGTDVMGPQNAIPGSVGGQSFGVDAVREFRVEAGTFSAQYGRAAGGVLNVITKSGTNELHGTVFEFLRNDNLDAPRWEDNRAGRERPEFKRNQFGFSSGGPIRRDHTFFFGNFEALRDRLGLTNTSIVPSLNALAGQIEGAGGRFTTINVSSAVRPYLNALYPLPNGADLHDGTAEYIYAVSTPTDENYFTARLDHNLGSSDSIFGRFTFDNADRREATGVGIFIQNTHNRNQFLTLQETHIFSPTMIGSMRFGYNRTLQGLLPEVDGVDEATLLRLAFVPGVPLLMQGTTLTPGSGITAIGNANLPRVWAWDLGEWSEDLAYSRGSHSLKFGGLVKKMLLHQREAKSAGGEYTFGSLTDFLQGSARDFRGLLPGAQKDVGYKYYYLGWYVQDDYRVNSRLTLNLGLRHEFYTGPRERYDRFCWLPQLADTRQECAAPNGGGDVKEGLPVFPTSLSTKDFGPRVGFAWDVNGDGKTAVRGGFGIFFDAMVPIWWQSAANGSFPVGSDLQITTNSFPNAYQLAVNGGNQVSYYVGTIRLDGVPSTMQTTLSVQRQLTSSAVLSVGYAGSLGRHLWVRSNENQREPTILPDGRKFWPAPPTGVTLGSRSLRRNPTWDDIRRVMTVGNSTYHGLLLGLQKRMSQGVQFQASYTYSKALDTGSSITAGARNGNGGTALLDPDNWKNDRSLSDFDMRHNLSFNSSVDLPFGHGKRWGSNWGGFRVGLLGGWQLSGIVKVSSGSAITITESGNNVSRNGLTNLIERPDLSPGASNNPVSGTSQGCTVSTTSVAAGVPLGSPDLWFDPCAFRVQELGFLGNVGRNTIIGPNTRTVDLSLLKDTAIPGISEDFHLQFRAEWFNLLNHSNLGAPSGAVFDSRGRISNAAAKITNTVGSARQIQFALKAVF